MDEQIDTDLVVRIVSYAFAIVMILGGAAMIVAALING